MNGVDVDMREEMDLYCSIRTLATSIQLCGSLLWNY